MKEKLLNCGTFAKICGVEKHVLFHYDDIDLFKPTYINEKGYRFYSYHQYDTFKIIQNLKKLGMSLKDIQIYLEQRSPDIFLSLLKQQEKKLIEAKRNLNQIHEFLKSLQKFTKEGICADTGKIFIEYQEERDILLSADLENTTDKDFATYMKDYISFTNKYDILSGEFAGIIMTLENIRNNRTSNYSYMYAYVNKKKSATTIKKEGKYLCGYHKGSYITIEETYKKMLSFARDNQFELGEYCYEEYLLAEFSESDFENYITRINIEMQ